MKIIVVVVAERSQQPTKKLFRPVSQTRSLLYVSKVEERRKGRRQFRSPFTQMICHIFERKREKDKKKNKRRKGRKEKTACKPQSGTQNHPSQEVTPLAEAFSKHERQQLELATKVTIKLPICLYLPNLFSHGKR